MFSRPALVVLCVGDHDESVAPKCAAIVMPGYSSSQCTVIGDARAGRNGAGRAAGLKGSLSSTSLPKRNVIQKCEAAGASPPRRPTVGARISNALAER